MHAAVWCCCHRLCMPLSVSRLIRYSDSFSRASTSGRETDTPHNSQRIKVDACSRFVSTFLAFRTISMSCNPKSFMIDDILRSEDTKKKDGNHGEEPAKSETNSHYNFIMNDFSYSQLHNASLTHPSSMPLMQGETWSLVMEVHVFESSNPFFSDPRVQTLFWQHLFLRRKIMLQLKPRKGGQIRFSHQQIIDLEKRFDKSKYLSAQERRRIASRINLTERQVKTWFQNRRAKWRRGSGIPETQDTDSNEDIDVDVPTPQSFAWA